MKLAFTFGQFCLHVRIDATTFHEYKWGTLCYLQMFKLPTMTIDFILQLVFANDVIHFFPSFLMRKCAFHLLC